MTIDAASPDEWDKAFKNWYENPPVNNKAPVYFSSDCTGPDIVSKPAHYNNGNIEAIDYIKQQLGDGYASYLEGNVLKYLHRYKYKNGVEDLRKAKQYLTWLIEETIK
jgi:hypothetical protein